MVRHPLLFNKILPCWGTWSPLMRDTVCGTSLPSSKIVIFIFWGGSAINFLGYPLSHIALLSYPILMDQDFKYLKKLSALLLFCRFLFS